MFKRYVDLRVAAHFPEPLPITVFHGCAQQLELNSSNIFKDTFVQGSPQWKTLHMHFPDLSSDRLSTVGRLLLCLAAPLTSPFEVRPGREPINTEESQVSKNALSGGRHSQLLLSMLAHPHLLQHTAQDLILGKSLWECDAVRRFTFKIFIFCNRVI